jgi:hypothetical protein
LVGLRYNMEDQKVKFGKAQNNIHVIKITLFKCKENNKHAWPPPMLNSGHQAMYLELFFLLRFFILLWHLALHVSYFHGLTNFSYVY